MKFQDMPYERIDFAKVQEEMGELIRELDAAKSGEEQFEVHKRYYALTDRVMTLMTIANIRFDIDTSDKFYEEEHKYYDEQGPVFSNLVLAYQKKLYESPYRGEDRSGSVQEYGAGTEVHERGVDPADAGGEFPDYGV